MNDQENYIAQAILSRSISLYRFTAGERAKILEILKRMEEDLIDLLLHAKLTDIGRRDRAQLLKQAQETIREYYGEAGDVIGQSLDELGRAEAAHTAGVIDAAFASNVNVQVPTESYFKSLLSDTLIQGAPSADWWSRQAGDVSFRFANEVRQGLAQAETNDQLVRRIRESVMPIAENNARALVQTSVQQVAADARRKTFGENSDVIEGIQQISTLDSRTSLICVAYSGAKFTLKGEPIAPTKLPYNGGVPRHWNCRSVEVPITKSLLSLGINLPEPPKGTRASDIGQIEATTTMTEFIRMRGRAFADQLLGEGRAQLFMDGKITLVQLLDQSGRPLSLKELNELAH